jgi:hypothetical protein
VFGRRLAIWTNPEEELKLRSTRTAVSFELVSTQVRLIWLEETADAVSEEGGETGAAPADAVRTRKRPAHAAAKTPLVFHASRRLIGSSPGRADFRRPRTPSEMSNRERVFDHRKTENGFKLGSAFLG